MNCVRVSRSFDENNKKVFVVRSGDVGIQLSQSEAYIVVSAIANLSGDFCIAKKESKESKKEDSKSLEA